MKKASILTLAVVLCSAISGHAQAFDGQRKGLQIGLGIGAHTTQFGFQKDFLPNSVDSEAQIAASVQLGYGFSNRIAGFVGGRAGNVVIDGTNARISISGFGGTFYFSPTSPSLYVTGMVGKGSLRMDKEERESADTGRAAMVGIGYEVTDRLHLEVSHARANLIAPDNAANKTYVESSFVTVRYIWY